MPVTVTRYLVDASPIYSLGSPAVGLSGAVMKGMEIQEDWSVPAALSAFLCMAIAFLIWWWYFDGANAAAERVITSKAESILRIGAVP